MHMRGQIPLPIPLLEQYPHSIRESGKITSTLKIARSESQISEFMARYNSILNQLHELSRHKILEVGIFFGPTPVNPREGYFLHFKYLLSEEDIPERTRLAACRKCIRSFLGYWAQDLPNSPPIMNTFLSVRLSSENPATPNSSLFPMGSEFTLREQFVPRFRRKGLSPAHLHIQSQDSKSLEDDDMQMEIQTSSKNSQLELFVSSPAESCDPCYVLSRGLKGIKSFTF
jgi:hypothetical protein